MKYYITKDGYIKVPITQEIIKKAKERSFEADKRTYFKENREIGFIGEEVFQTVFSDAEFAHKYGYDFNWRTFRVEVKSKRRNVYPLESYEATVPKYRLDNQHCDIFVFMSFIKTNEAFILGWITYNDFKQKSILRDKGFKDKNNVTYREGTYDLKIKELKRFDMLLSALTFNINIDCEYERKFI